MPSYILPLFGIALSFGLIIKREQIGDMIGEGDWMRKLGGVYHVVIYVAVIIFFWSIAELTGTTKILLSPIQRLMPWGIEQPAKEPTDGMGGSF